RSYSAQFTFNGTTNPVYLKLDDAECASVRLYVNGEYVGIKYWEPNVFDMTKFIKPGKNKAEIILSTTLFNVMGPNRISGILESSFVGPGTFLQMDRFTRKYTLVPFGMGRVVVGR
ncbi:MAG: hypothetical protein MJA82_19240, partial [Clostridia bacterium]|nr:hypothetical protein [Clostridia bacterium]